MLMKVLVFVMGHWDISSMPVPVVGVAARPSKFQEFWSVDVVE